MDLTILSPRITDISYRCLSEAKDMYAIIACGVFQKELERIAGDLGFPFEAHYLGAGLHVDFDELGDALKDELEKCKDCEGIIVAYGECHPKICEILEPYHAALIKCQNCVDAFITRKAVENIARKGLYFYLSPGWMECWREILARLNWGQEETRLQLGSFKGSVFMDTLRNAADYEQDLIEFLDYTLLPYEIMPVDMEHFKSLILEAKKRLEA
jgi:hypothetical protein